MSHPSPYPAFFDELRKIAASSGLLRHAKGRMGKRPLRASTLLKKDKDGTLRKTAEGSQGGSIPFAANDPASTGKPAQAPKAAGDVPSREDGRDNQQTRIPGTGRTSLAPAAVNEPSEHGNM